MHGITIDSGRALDMLASMIEEAEQQYQAHIRETPHYEPASAGEGFVAYGESINSLFQLLHQRNAQRLDVMSRDVVLAPARNDTVPIQEVSVQTACH
ncbi:hypothetical protein CIP107559_00617 [Corynebacterium diphtheriae]|nr:hypothetical protein CIP107559_00617 [Corynebacterium diphtheriae]